MCNEKYAPLKRNRPAVTGRPLSILNSPISIFSAAERAGAAVDIPAQVPDPHTAIIGSRVTGQTVWAESQSTGQVIADRPVGSIGGTCPAHLQEPVHYTGTTASLVKQTKELHGMQTQTMDCWGKGAWQDI